MPAHKSQKRAEIDERIKKALIELMIQKFKSIHAITKEYNVDHITLFRRAKEGKFIAESHEFQQIFTISKENVLAECITRFSIVEHSSKQAFIPELAEKI